MTMIVEFNESEILIINSIVVIVEIINWRRLTFLFALRNIIIWLVFDIKSVFIIIIIFFRSKRWWWISNTNYVPPLSTYVSSNYWRLYNTEYRYNISKTYDSLFCSLMEMNGVNIFLKIANFKMMQTGCLIHADVFVHIFTIHFIIIWFCIKLKT